jgi:small subunit ribosomal protein S21
MSRFRDGRKTRGISVEVRNDDFGRALRTFGKKVQDSGLLKEVRDRMAYEKPAVERQRMKKQARKRWERAVEEMIAQGSWHKDRKY